MRSAAIWMLITAFLIFAYIWGENQFYMPKPEEWPKVDGKILSSTIKTLQSEQAKTFQLQLNYEYKDGDKILQGTRIRPSEITYKSLEQAQRAIKHFPQNKNIKVYVNPVKKSQPGSVLVWDFPDILSPVIFIVLILAATGASLLFYVEYKMMQPER